MGENPEIESIKWAISQLELVIESLSDAIGYCKDPKREDKLREIHDTIIRIQQELEEMANEKG